MKKTYALLLAVALAGTAVAGPAFAHDRPGPAGPAFAQDRPGPTGPAGLAGPGGRGAASLPLAMLWAGDDARIDALLDRIADRLDLTEDQLPLFEDLRAALGTVRADLAEVAPDRETLRDLGFVERLEMERDRLAAGSAAIDAVLPSVSALSDALSENQLEGVRLGHHGERPAPRR